MRSLHEAWQTRPIIHGVVWLQWQEKIQGLAGLEDAAEISFWAMKSSRIFLFLEELGDCFVRYPVELFSAGGQRWWRTRSRSSTT